MCLVFLGKSKSSVCKKNWKKFWKKIAIRIVLGSKPRSGIGSQKKERTICCINETLRPKEKLKSSVWWCVLWKDHRNPNWCAERWYKYQTKSTIINTIKALINLFVMGSINAKFEIHTIDSNWTTPKNKKNSLSISPQIKFEDKFARLFLATFRLYKYSAKTAIRIIGSAIKYRIWSSFINSWQGSVL